MKLDLGRGQSIVAPIVLLVVAAVAVASLAQFAITFNGPPPFSPPTTIAEIAQALKTGTTPQERRDGVRVTEGAFLGEHGEPSPQRDAMIADVLGVPAEQVVGRYDRPMVGPMHPHDGPAARAAPVVRAPNSIAARQSFSASSPSCGTAPKARAPSVRGRSRSSPTGTG